MNKPIPVDGHKGTAQIWLGAVVVAGFFALLIVLFWPGNAQDSTLDSARLMMLGALIAGFSSVLGYYFGSTSGSAAKTALLANSTPTPTTPVQVTTTSEQGMVTTLTDPNLQEIEALQTLLTALQLKGIATPEDVAEQARITRRLDELRNPTTN